MIEVKLLHVDGSEFDHWIFENAIVRRSGEMSSVLSGSGIRQELYFATAPGNSELYVAETRNGLIMQLPAL